VNGAWKLPIARVGKDDLFAIHLKQNNKEMQFAEFMDIVVSLATATYRMHKSTIRTPKILKLTV
jgi:hypothetical protein